MKNSELLQIMEERLKNEQILNNELKRKMIFGKGNDAKIMAKLDLMFSNGKIDELEYFIDLLKK